MAPTAVEPAVTAPALSSVESGSPCPRQAGNVAREASSASVWGATFVIGSL